MLKLNEELRRYGFIYPDDPASYPCSLVGGRIGTERLVVDRRALRPHPRPRDQLPDGAAHRRDDRGGRRRRPQDPQVVDRLPAQAPVHGPPGHARHRHRGDPRARAAARGRVRGLLLAIPTTRRPGARTGRARALGPRDARRRRALRRVEDRLPAPRRRGLHPPAAGGQGGGGHGDVRHGRRGAAGRQAAAQDRPRQRRRLPRRRDLPGRLGLAPRPLRDAAARPRAQTARWCR